MTLYFAPLEGVTDAVFRRIHHECFPGVSKYFIPFISPTQNLAFTSRDWAAIAPENNIGVPAVPQLLAKDAALFLWAAQALCDMGYPEVNLNLGCPSGTVTAKGKGSGLLADVPALERLLDGIFEKPPIPVSIKTRIGYARVEEWDRLLDVFARYPIHELIIHPRTRAEFYRGTPHADAFAKAYGTLGMPLCYNGDLFSEADCLELTRHFPNTHALMLGRGLIANPAFSPPIRQNIRRTLRWAACVKLPNTLSAVLKRPKSHARPSAKPAEWTRIWMPCAAFLMNMN